MLRALVREGAPVWGVVSGKNTDTQTINMYRAGPDPATHTHGINLPIFLSQDFP